VSPIRKILVALALVLAWALVSVSSASATDCPNTTSLSPLLSQSQMQTSITCLINEERTSHGLQPVVPNSDLRDAALSHSNDMVAKGYFEHTSPDGITFLDRIAATGYTRARSWVVGENLVWGLGTFSTPQSMVTAWMNSPPHRENLLKPVFREIGVAAVPGTPETISNPLGITVSSEYGYRAGKNAKKAHSAKKKRKVQRRRARPAAATGFNPS
jgi:uncharacterized protein YkwD